MRLLSNHRPFRVNEDTLVKRARTEQNVKYEKHHTFFDVGSGNMKSRRSRSRRSRRASRSKRSSKRAHRTRFEQTFRGKRDELPFLYRTIYGNDNDLTTQINRLKKEYEVQFVGGPFPLGRTLVRLCSLNGKGVECFQLPQGCLPSRNLKPRSHSILLLPLPPVHTFRLRVKKNNLNVIVNE